MFKWKSGRARTRYFSGRRPALANSEVGSFEQILPSRSATFRKGWRLQGEFHAHISTRQPNQHPIARSPQKKVDHEHQSFHHENSNSSVRAGILANVPSLRAFAISLSGNIDRADDLVQDTLLRALAKINSFKSRTNLPSPFCASH